MTADVAANSDAPAATEPVPQWMFPPVEGFSADDLDRLPDLPPHTELIDGSLVLVSPQKDLHTTLVSFLESRLREQAPAAFRARREMTVVLGRDQRPEPDVLVVQADAVGRHMTKYPASAVELAVEVVSPESASRDRARKPQLYARAGIPHFWRVEDADDRPVVYVYELDPATREYGLSGVHRERLKVTAPFAIDIDLAEVDTW